MTTAKLAARLTALEAEVARLKAKVDGQSSRESWWNKIAGSFANDPIYEEAMRLGRGWRESQRPKRVKKQRPKNGNS